ncbi:sugar kinase [Achromatium sp. WMS2]|nr:sugar kinase [Achromatium sp. WMS2]
MSILICGSFAYDTIMVFHGQFKDHILPEQLRILNVSFLVPELRREFGGCSGNIAYNLHLLGAKNLPMGTVGKDFTAYAEWLDKIGIKRQYVRVMDDSYTAQAYITTDRDSNQITAFHPGAMNYSHINRVTDAPGITLGSVSPDSFQGMIEHAQQFAEAGIPFVFDPGQGLPMFSAEQLNNFVAQASYLALNDYEAKLMQDRTGKSPEQLAKETIAVIVTQGAQGSLIYTKEHCYEIPPAPAKVVKDPTGCGDAYRAGLLHGINQGMDWDTIGRLAGLLGSIKVEHDGTQNHSFTQDELQQRFKEAYGFAIE